MAIVFNDRLVETVGEEVMIRTSDDRIYRVVRVEDGMHLDTSGSLAAARARAQAIIDWGRA